MTPDAPTRRIRLERLLLVKPVSAGLNPYVIMSLAYMYRSSNDDAPPIRVTREGRYYRVSDGRHRVIASIMAGRRRVLAVVE